MHYPGYAHLAASVERSAPLEHVMPAWRRLIEEFPKLKEAGFMSYRTLLWAARIVYHRIAGAPLGEVADWLHAELVRPITTS